MADIARLAGVSVSTVSRALSDSPLVNAETRERITELARSLKYSINAGAQNLRLKQNRTVSMVVPYDPSTRQHLSDPFFLGLIGSVADALTELGHDLLLSRVDANRLDLAAQPYDTGRAIGLVLIGQWHHHDQLNEMALRGMPFVVWGAQLSNQLYATVGSDNLAGGKLATQHLLAQGARHIAFVGDPELPEIGQRWAGYLAAHAAHGITPEPALCRRVPFVTDTIRQDTEALLRSGMPLDGVFASSDLAAMTVIAALRRHGLRVPEDVAVVGYDDIALAAHFHPPLTTVRQPIEAAGRALVESVLSQVAGAKPRSHLLVTELVLRETTRAPAVPRRPARSAVGRR
jgi:DNA-binding LacI/PurR family transcriptional regulator